MKKSKGVYEWQEGNVSLDIHYNYYWDDGDHETPAEDELDIDKVYLNGVDITQFYHNYLVDYDFQDDLNQYARDNRW